MKQSLVTKMAHHKVNHHSHLDHHQLLNAPDDHHHHYKQQRISSPKTSQNDNDKRVVMDQSSSSSNREKKGLGAVPVEEEAGKEESSSEVEEEEEVEENGRERLKRHRIEMAGRVWIPEIWGQEDLLKDWIDCNAFDACLVPNGIMSARASLVEEGRRATSSGLRIENRC